MGDEARLDIAARGFWQAAQSAFLDVRVFNPNAKRYAKMELTKAYEYNEKENKRLYNERILQLEHGSFTPLVFSATGRMGRECKKFFARLAEMIAEKRKTNYNTVMTWMRWKISFSLIRSIGTCLCGSRTMFSNVHLETSVSQDVVMSDE